MIALALFALAACGSDGSSTERSAEEKASESESESAADGTEMFPDVVKVEVSKQGGQFQVAATLNSPYDTPERYADGWRVLDPDGNELGVLKVDHDHASEQPFTRELTLSIPDDVDEITVEGRDQVSGYGGKRATAPVPRNSG